MLDLFQGKPLHELDLDDVQALLDDAEAEPLTWEAKGIAVKAGEVRKQVCGFGNSHGGGYLLLGTAVVGGEWTLDGAEFPNEDPPAWISQVAGEVQPYLDGLDTRAIRVGRDKWIAVVWVPPSPTPPCNAHGTVYERVSGRTVSVREPLRLAQLFARGDAARERAQRGAAAATEKAYVLGKERWPLSGGVIVSVGLCASGYEPDISRRLFSRSTFQLVVEEAVPKSTSLVEPRIIAEHRQDAVIVWTEAQIRDPGDREWFLRAAWDGSVGVACRVADERSTLDGLVDGPLREAWTAACVALATLSPVGAAYLRIKVDGAQFEPGSRHGEEDTEDLVLYLSTVAPGPVDRGPIGRTVDEALLPGIRRELERIEGGQAFEDDSP
jgi:hypothetical protein